MFNNKEKEKIAATTQQDLGSDSGDETKIITMGLKGKDSIASTISSRKPIETQNERERIELFHIRIITKNNKVDTLFDSGSQANFISKDTVKKLNLETIPHPKPYTLGWVCDNAKLQVTRKCILVFSINANFIDEVELNVIPLDICGIVLGSPYLYDRKYIFHHHENKYHFFKDGIEYIVREHSKNLNLSLVNAGQMKRFVNASQIFTLLMIKHKDVDEYEVFQGYESSLKSDFIEVVNPCDKMFQEFNILAPKREKQYEVHLQQNASLLSIGMNKMSVLKNAKIKKKKLFYKEDIGSKISSCGFHNVLASRTDSAWR